MVVEKFIEFLPFNYKQDKISNRLSAISVTKFRVFEKENVFDLDALVARINELVPMDSFKNR